MVAQFPGIFKARVFFDFFSKFPGKDAHFNQIALNFVSVSC